MLKEARLQRLNSTLRMVVHSCRVAGGIIDIKPLVTKRFELTKAVDAFHAAADPRQGAIKVQLHLGLARFRCHEVWLGSGAGAVRMACRLGRAKGDMPAPSAALQLFLRSLPLSAVPPDSFSVGSRMARIQYMYVYTLARNAKLNIDMLRPRSICFRISHFIR